MRIGYSRDNELVDEIAGDNYLILTASNWPWRAVMASPRIHPVSYGDAANGQCGTTDGRSKRILSPTMVGRWAGHVGASRAGGTSSHLAIRAFRLRTTRERRREPVVPGNAVDYDTVTSFKHRLLKTAWTNFSAGAGRDLKFAFDQFRNKQAHWLDDYALFRALRLRTTCRCSWARYRKLKEAGEKRHHETHE